MARRRPHRIPQDFTKPPGRRERCEDQIAVWSLRALLHAQSDREITERLDELDRSTVRALGLPVNVRGKVPSPSRTLASARERLAVLERDCVPSCNASRNATLLGRVLGLAPPEIATLALVLAAQETRALSMSIDLLMMHGGLDAYHAIAVALALPVRVVRRALSRDGALRSIPVLQRDATEVVAFAPGSAVEEALGDLLDGEEDLIRHYVTPAPRPTRVRADFPHLTREHDLVVHLLRAAHKERAPGVNVLLYGPPGTGKTAFARLVAREAGATLFESKLEDDDQDAREGRQRLEAYALCQRMLRGREHAVLLFDEAEDVFPPGLSIFGMRVQQGERRKAWTNRLLEESPVPTIWISNSIDGIDPAHVRRFDCAIEVGQPPRSVRRRVLDRHLRGLGVSPEYRAELSDVEDLSPGHVQRAARVLRLLATGTTTDLATGTESRASRASTEATLDQVLEGNLRACTGKRPKRRGARRDIPYDLSLLNTSADVAGIVAGLRRTGAGTLCLYGPPGTGKTAFARHVAEEIDRPLVTKRASDLLSKWVGDNEKNIAGMFEEAEREGAVLLLDEADSFLQDRRGAVRSWEVTLVNEMLTQMESFQGVFICSTNLFDQLDAASLRRFAIKVRFDYMTDAQARRLFVATLRTLGASDDAVCDEHALRAIARLKRLTPGDFAAVVRQMRVTGESATAMGLLRALEQECAMKRDTTARVVGFGG